MNDQLKIGLPKSVSSSLTGLGSAMKHAPALLAIIILVGGFLWYLERHDVRESAEHSRVDQLASLRIQTCHALQERSVQSIEILNETLRDQTEAFIAMTNTLEALEKEAERAHRNY